MTKKEIIKDMKSLRDKVYDYNNQVKPHSENDYWSGEIYSFICENLIKPLTKRKDS